MNLDENSRSSNMQTHRHFPPSWTSAQVLSVLWQQPPATFLSFPNLFILRGIINHANYLGKELWLTFYDIEKCFDSLWLEDCINSLWDLGVKDDVLCLIYLMNIKATVTIKTPFGDTDPLFLSNFVKQGTVLGPVLNNCSLNKLSTDSIGYNFGLFK